MKLLALLLTLSLTLFAKAPRDFSKDSNQFRFVDFDQVTYDITYDTKAETVSVVTEIFFNQRLNGKPIFDLIPEVKSIEIDGIKVNALTISSPQNETKYRSIDKNITAGDHKLVITNIIEKNVSFDAGSVSSAFWMSDLNDRQYIEQYIPTNIEYDQFAVKMNINIENASKAHTLYTNGNFINKAKNSFTVNYPKYFTASSLYFHLAPSDKFQSTSFNFKSKSNQQIPVVIYKKKSFWGTSLTALKEKTISVLTELESKFGNWPHKSLTIYNAGSGGMEYSGATITSTSALGHELTHSYFARGVMPVDGNSGWMDEAIASWRDAGYKSVKSPNFSATKMAAHSQYRRFTDRNAYTNGANFMAYLNNRLESVGGLTLFLNELHTNFTHKNIFTSDFINEINKFSGENFNSDFDKYIFAKEGGSTESILNNIDNPYHPKLSDKELLELL